MNETRVLWAAGAATFAGVWALVWWLMSAPAEAPVPAPAALALAPALPSTPAASTGVPTRRSTAACSLERLSDWTLMSLGQGGYRENGFAVLHHGQRGTLTVKENTPFDGELRIQRLGERSVDLVCGEFVQTKRLPGAFGATSESANPDMRTALPPPLQ